MKTAVAETSRLAFDALNKSGKSLSQREKVFAYLVANPEGMTNAEIGDSLGLAASTVAGRVHELKKCGAVDVLGVRKCRLTKNTAKVHGVGKGVKP